MKEQKQEEAYNAVIEIKNQREEQKPQPKKTVKAKPKPEPEPVPEPEEEPEEEPDEEEIVRPKPATLKKPIPPPNQ
jgi:hypothetical protein